MVDQGLIAFVAGLAGFWTVALLLYRGEHGKVEVHPGYIIVRAGIRMEPMGDGLGARLWRLFGWASLFALALAAGLFYYYSFNLFVLRYISPPECGGAPAGFVPFIPGVTMSWKATIYILLAIGVAALVHELAHAYVARAVGLRVRDAGLAFFLFIPAAFVEPDEDEMKKAPRKSRLLVYSAGVGSNIALALVVTGLASLLMAGALITSVAPDSPAMEAGLEPGMVVVAVNGTPVGSAGDLIRILREAGVPDPTKDVTLVFTVEKDGALEEIVVHRPGNESAGECDRGVIGISIRNYYEYVPQSLGTFLELLFIISLSLAVVNAAPLVLPLPGGAVYADGAYVLKDLLEPVLGEEKAALTTVAVGAGTLLLLFSLMSLQQIM